MRVTQETKQATRERILAVAQKLFRADGFEQTTTRAIATEAEIASGTLFNYFPTKEAIVLTLVAEAIQRGQGDFDKKQNGEAALEEDLFALVAAGLRRMKPYRKFLQPALETALSPLASSRGLGEPAEMVRLDHLETVQRLLREHGVGEPPPAVGIQLYWTLYTGVLAFWANDSSPKQEDTLALLDQSLRMFVRWLTSDGQEAT